MLNAVVHVCEWPAAQIYVAVMAQCLNNGY